MNEIAVSLFQNPSTVYRPIRSPLQGEESLLRPIAKDPFDHQCFFRAPINYLVENARILGASNLILNRDNEAALENICFNPRIADKIFDKEESCHRVVDGQIFFEPQTTANLENAIFLGSHWNYGHWLFNHLSRLYFCEDLNSETIVVVSSTLNKRYASYLEFFGIRKENIFEIQPGMVLEVANLMIPQMPWNSLSDRSAWFAPGCVDFIREALGTNGPSTGAADLKIFLSRKKARWRRVINEDQLFDYVKSYGFSRIDPADLSVDEQIDIGIRTKMLISPFGANSNFLINLPTGAAVMELSPPLDSMNVSQYFADAAGLSYQQVFGSPELTSYDNSQSQELASIDFNYVVEMSLFKQRFHEYFRIAT